MESQTTERPKCKKNKTVRQKWHSVWLGIQRELIKIAKKGLRRLLLNPTTFKWLMVHVPDAAEKVEQFVRGFISSLMDLF